MIDKGSEVKTMRCVCVKGGKLKKKEVMQEDQWSSSGKIMQNGEPQVLYFTRRIFL